VTGLAGNLERVRQRIAAATVRVGRDPAEITLVAVTKGQPVEAISGAYRLGVRHFGENRVEEAEAKVGSLPHDISWHMIGHIQSRKARRVPSVCGLVHSVDSLDLARRLDRVCWDRPEPLPILLEINVSGEESKYGFRGAHWSADGAEWRALLGEVAEILALPHLAPRGLMTMAPYVRHADEARPVFASLRRLRDELRSAFPQAAWQDLSMGMTDDFEVAVEEGATLVRIGRAIFAGAPST
jgi:pyridoxal phosphate enzyme (YggS family)